MRKEARIFTSIWRDEDFLKLTPEAQRMYMLLLSQPELTMCGMLTLAENRWMRSAAGLTKAKVRDALTQLTQSEPRPFVLVDYATDEVLVRAFVRRDHVLHSPKLVKPFTTACLAVQSPALRRTLRDELQAAMDGGVHPDVLDTVEQLVKALSQVNTLSDRVSGGVSDRVPDTLIRRSSSSLTPAVVERGARGTRIPADFAKQITEDMVAWAKQRAPHVNGKLETEKFVNHWTAASGTTATKRDWKAAWRNWLLQAEEWAGQGKQAPSHDANWMNLSAPE
jgi:hypothetical protein